MVAPDPINAAPQLCTPKYRREAMNGYVVLSGTVIPPMILSTERVRTVAVDADQRP